MFQRHNQYPDFNVALSCRSRLWCPNMKPICPAVSKQEKCQYMHLMFCNWWDRVLAFLGVFWPLHEFINMTQLNYRNNKIWRPDLIWNKQGITPLVLSTLFSPWSDPAHNYLFMQFDLSLVPVNRTCHNTTIQQLTGKRVCQYSKYYSTSPREKFCSLMTGRV